MLDMDKFERFLEATQLELKELPRLLEMDRDAIVDELTIEKNDTDLIQMVLIDRITQRVAAKAAADKMKAEKTRSEWEAAREELQRRIAAELDSYTGDEKSIWYLEASAGDMSEFTTMLGVIDGIMDAEPLPWDEIICEMESS